MKKTLTFSIVSALFLLAFASCKKDYECRCSIEFVVDGKVVNKSSSINNVTALNHDDAAKQCKYFEEEVDYLGQKAVKQHYCGL